MCYPITIVTMQEATTCFLHMQNNCRAIFSSIHYIITCNSLCPIKKFLFRANYSHQVIHLSWGTQTCKVFTLVFPEAFFQASQHQLQICGSLQTACQWPSGLHSAPNGNLPLSFPPSAGHASWLRNKKNVRHSLYSIIYYKDTFLWNNN